MIGPINLSSRDHNWILAVTDCYVKWVEIVTLKQADGAAIANFIRYNAIFRFANPKLLLSDNGTRFLNAHVR